MQTQPTHSIQHGVTCDLSAPGGGGGGNMIYLESSMGWEFMTTFGRCLILE